MGIRERQQREKEVMRQNILDAARELIRDAGYENLTIRKIAERVEYSPMALYNHFSDKTDILTALATEGFAKIGRILPKPGGDSIATLRSAMLQYIDFGLRHPDEYELIFMTRRGSEKKEPSKATSLEAIPNAGGRQAFERMLEYVDSGLDAGSLQGDRFTLSKVLWAGIHGCVALQITQTGFPFGPPKKFAEAVVDALLEGVTSKQQVASVRPSTKKR